MELNAIKVNVDEISVKFSVGFLDKFKKAKSLCFAFSDTGVVLYKPKKGISKSHYTFIITKDILVSREITLENNPSVAEFIFDLTHFLYLDHAWNHIVDMSKLTVTDNHIGKREYIFYFTEIETEMYKFNVSNFQQKSWGKGYCQERCINASPKKTKYILKNESGCYTSGIYRTSSYHLPGATYSTTRRYYVSSQIIERDSVIAYLGKVYVHGNNIKKPFDKLYFMNIDTDSFLRGKGGHVVKRVLAGRKLSPNYLYERIDIEGEDVVVKFISYNRFVYECLHKKNLDFPVTQTIALTRYIQAVFPNLTSEEVKQKADEIIFEINPKAVDIIEVTGEKIQYYYLEENYLYKDRGSLGNSCMRYKKCQKDLEFYAKNSNASLAVALISDKVVGRAIVWTCVDGTRVMDRPYTSDTKFNRWFINWAKKNNVDFVYDYRDYNGDYENYSGDFGGASGFLDTYTKNYIVKLDWLPVDRNFTLARKYQNHTSDYNIPYLDNLCYIDEEMKLLSNNLLDWNAYLEEYHWDKLLVITKYGRELIEKTSDKIVKLEDGSYERKNECVFVKRRECWVFRTEARVVRGEWEHKDDCVRKEWGAEWELRPELRSEPQAENETKRNYNSILDDLLDDLLEDDVHPTPSPDSLVTEDIPHHATRVTNNGQIVFVADPLTDDRRTIQVESDGTLTLGNASSQSMNISLSWSDSQDNVGAASYDVYRNGVLISNVNNSITIRDGQTPREVVRESTGFYVPSTAAIGLNALGFLDERRDQIELESSLIINDEQLEDVRETRIA